LVRRDNHEITYDSVMKTAPPTSAPFWIEQGGNVPAFLQPCLSHYFPWNVESMSLHTFKMFWPIF